MIANRGDKVVCVNKNRCRYITIGKIYEVEGVTDDGQFYFISNNRGGEYYYSTTFFIPLNEWREQQINKIL